MSNLEEHAQMSNKEYAIVAIQLGHLTESQNRIENAVHELVRNVRADLTVRIDNLEKTNNERYKDLSDKMDKEKELNIQFRARQTIWLTVAAFAATMVSQFLFNLI